MPVIIRNEKQGEAAVISALIARAFQNTAHTNHQEQHIVEKLRQDRQLTLSLVAENAGIIIGYAALSPVAVSDGSRNWHGLGPIAVEPVWQKRGVGTKLINAALDKLRALGAHGCVVLGEPGYYQHFGFKADKNLVLVGAPPHYFMALHLRGTAAKGEVFYHPAFAG